MKETLRTALALGADRAVHVEVTGKDYELLQPLAVSKLIAAVAKKENVDLVVLGKLVSRYHEILNIIEKVVSFRIINVAKIIFCTRFIFQEIKNKYVSLGY